MHATTRVLTTDDATWLLEGVKQELSQLQEQVNQLRKENQQLNNRVNTLTKAVHHQSQGMY
jgi:cell division protein FtsB